MTSTTLPAKIADHSRAPVAAAFAGTHTEFQALLTACGVYDLSNRAKIIATGGDRVRWMNGMVTNNIRDLAIGRGVYAFLLNAQGRIQADLYVFQRGDSLLIDLEGGQREKVLQLFDRYIIADDVELADIGHQLTAVGLTGPESRHVLEHAGIPVPDLAHLQIENLTWRDKPITLLRSGEEVGESWQVWLAPETASELWEALTQGGAQSVGTDALNLFRISRGIPELGVDIRDRDLPQETGQTRALNFTKGCYLGQEIVERIRSRGAVHRRFTTFTIDGELPQPGAKIVAEEKEVGEVTSSATLPLTSGDHAVALGYLRREAADKSLHAGTARLKPVAFPLV